MAKCSKEISFLILRHFFPQVLIYMFRHSVLCDVLYSDPLFCTFVVPYNPHCGGRGYSHRLYFTVEMMRLMLRSSQKQKLGDFHVVLDNCHANNNNDNSMAWGCFTVLTLGTVEEWYGTSAALQQESGLCGMKYVVRSRKQIKQFSFAFSDWIFGTKKRAVKYEWQRRG